MYIATSLQLESREGSPIPIFYAMNKSRPLTSPLWLFFDERAKSIAIVAGFTQTTPSQYALAFV